MRYCAFATAAFSQWHGMSSTHSTHILIRLSYRLHSTFSRTMPPMNPTPEASSQQTENRADAARQTSRQHPRCGKNQTQDSRSGPATQQPATDNGAITTNPTDIPTQSMPHQLHRNQAHNPNSIAGPRQKDHLDRRITRSMATSTRPSFHNRQWRTPDSQPQQHHQATSQAGTEGLTQALERLTTEDNGQATATATKPTKSRWRTAKPNQRTGSKPGPNTKTQSANTKVGSNSNSRKPNKTRQSKPPAPPKRGMLFDLLSLHHQSRKECAIHS